MAKSRGINRRWDTEFLISESKRLHPSTNWDYRETVFAGVQGDVVYSCLDHEKPVRIVQRFIDHIYQRSGCTVCWENRKHLAKLQSTAWFIQKSKAIFGDLFLYGRTEYRGMRYDVSFYCMKHGLITVRAGNHLYAKKPYGCKHCNAERAALDENTQEREVDTFIKSLGFSTQRSNREFLGRKELDIYISSTKTAVEYNGIWWHNEAEGVGKRPRGEHDAKFKTDACKSLGIDLIHVFEDDWVVSNERCRNWLRARLGRYENCVDVEKCSISLISAEDAEVFVDTYSILPLPNYDNLYLGLTTVMGDLVSVVAVGAREDLGLNFQYFRSLTEVRGSMQAMISTTWGLIEDSTHMIAVTDLTYENGKALEASGFKKYKAAYPTPLWSRNNGKKRYAAHEVEATLKKAGADPGYGFQFEKYGFYRIWGCGQEYWRLDR